MLSELCKELAVRCPNPLAANVASTCLNRTERCGGTTGGRELQPTAAVRGARRPECTSNSDTFVGEHGWEVASGSRHFCQQRS